jgi:hypothetical protein
MTELGKMWWTAFVGGVSCLALASGVGCGTDVSEAPVSSTSTGDTTSSGQGGGGGLRSGPGGTTTTTSTGGMGGMGGDGGVGGADNCAPDPDDSSCGACMKQNCCAELTACDMDTVCSCWRVCRRDGNSFMECEQMCGTPGQLSLDLRSCRMSQCSQDCSGGQGGN